MANPHTATWDDVARWITGGVFRVDDAGQVWKGERELARRENLRKGCNYGDDRVDLQYEGKRRSTHVSSLVWIRHTGQAIPPGFEIHHLDEDPNNNCFDNLVCVHSLDHLKLHVTEYEDDGIPF